MKNCSILFLLLFLFSCTARERQRRKRNLQNGGRDYSVTVYSNGKPVFEDHFHGIISQENGDGIYYFKGDTLIEVAGTYVIKSEK